MTRAVAQTVKMKKSSINMAPNGRIPAIRVLQKQQRFMLQELSNAETTTETFIFMSIAHHLGYY